MPAPVRQRTSPRLAAGVRSASAEAAAGTRSERRERVLAAAGELLAARGYGGLSVDELAARAGISKSTFYALFENKETCVRAALESAGAYVLSTLERTAGASAVGTLETGEVLGSLLGELFGALAREPASGWLLMVESLAAPSEVRAVHREMMASAIRIGEAALDAAAARGSRTLDVPVLALAGGIRAVATRRLQNHEADRLPRVANGLLAWMRSYAVAPGRPRWSVSEVSLRDLDSRRPPKLAGSVAAGPLPRGKSRLHASARARNQRARIIQACAELCAERDYEQITVAMLVSAAAISRDVFYEHYTGKLDAFRAAHEAVVQVATSTCASAFFQAGPSWEHRIWSALRTVCELIAAQPAHARLIVVDSFAGGREARRHLEDAMRTATIFLEEGYHRGERAQALPRVCSEAIAGALFEMVYDCVADGRAAEMPRHLGQLAYVVLAPFLGPRDAVALIERLA